MPLQITNDGVQIETLEEILDRLAASYRSIYGADINLDQDTADGQRLGIMAKAVFDAQTAGLDTYNSMDVDLSLGQALDRNSKIAGISRRPATNSTWDIEVTASKAVELYSGYTIRDDAGQDWIKDTAVNIPIGTTTVTFESVTLGAVQGLIGAGLEQVTILTEVTTLAASVSATVGIDEETDEELRIRRNKSTENPAFSTIGSLTSKILDLDDVVDAFVYENKTSTYDATLDLNSHSIWAIVEGGEIADIVETMARQKTGGTGIKGTVTGTYTETIVRPDGSTFDIIHEMKFDRPVITELYVNVNATRTTPNPVDTALIADNIASRRFTIGEAIHASSLYTEGAKLGTGFYLSDLEISDDSITFTDEQLDGIAAGRYNILSANVTVTEVIPP